MLVAGNSSGLYYTILPEPGTVIPTLNIEQAVIISRDMSSGEFDLEGAPTPTGPWETVTLPENVIGDTIQVAVPASYPLRFFRLVSR